MQRQGQMIRQWGTLCDKVWLYNYNYTMLVSKFTLTPMVHRVRRNIPLLKAVGRARLPRPGRSRLVAHRHPHPPGAGGAGVGHRRPTSMPCSTTSTAAGSAAPPAR